MHSSLFITVTRPRQIYVFINMRLSTGVCVSRLFEMKSPVGNFFYDSSVTRLIGLSKGSREAHLSVSADIIDSGLHARGGGFTNRKFSVR